MAGITVGVPLALLWQNAPSVYTVGTREGSRLPEVTGVLAFTVSIKELKVRVSWASSMAFCTAKAQA